jgi:transposase
VAVQVADRYHLWANLCEAVEKTVWAHRGCRPNRNRHPGRRHRDVRTGPDARRQRQPRRLVARKQRQHAAIQQLRDQGYSLTAISRQLGVCFRPVQRYAAAASIDELLAPAIHRSSVLDGHADYIHRRHAEGLTDAAVLHVELQTRGWRGSLRTVQRYLRPLRPPATATQAAPAPNRQSARPAHPRDQPAARPRRGHRRTHLAYRSGAIEGRVNRIKALKRAMFSRANLDLLRQRLLIPY